MFGVAAFGCDVDTCARVCMREHVHVCAHVCVCMREHVCVCMCVRVKLGMA